MKCTLIVCVIASIMLAGMSVGTSVQDSDNSEVAWQSRDDEHLIELFTVEGRPLNLDPDHKVKILVNHSYAVGYCEERRNPLWAVYRASELKVGDEAERYERSRFFARDLRVTPAIDGRTFGGGLDRGHMVPNAVIGSQYGSLAQLETFYMTNMCPQQDSLNRGPWMRLEKFIIDLAQDKEHIFVLAGPIFGDDPGVTAKGPERGIQVPEAYYMILVDAENEFADKPTIKLIAYRFVQNTAQSADFKDRILFGVSVNDIEAETGLDFFPFYEELFTNWDAKEAEIEMTHWTIN